MAMDEQMKDKLTLEILQSLSPLDANGDDIATKTSRDLLMTCIRTNPRVQSVFFPNSSPHPLQKAVDFRAFPLDPLAVTFVSEVIANVKDIFRFHSTINKAAVDLALRNIYESLQWKKLGFQMYTVVYPEVVRDVRTGVALKHFMADDGSLWADRLLSELHDQRWTCRVQQRIVRGLYQEETYNADMNALFVKLHLLDPQAVIPAYQLLLNQRALPAVNLELATRNYLGGPLDWRKAQTEVEAAERRPSFPLHSGSRRQLAHHLRGDLALGPRDGIGGDVDGLRVFHGVAVDEFVVTECRNLGLWSGLRADNVRLARPEPRCRLM